MKAALKIMALFLVLCQMAFCVCSCGRIFSLLSENDATDSEGVTETETDSETETELVFTLTKEMLADYVIVVPGETDEDMTGAAELLQRMIERVIEVKLEIRKDTEAEVRYEILVGPTDRAETQKFYGSVKQYDSGYARVGDKILIVGRLNNKAEDAALAFHAFALSTAEASDVLLEDGAKEIVSDNDMNALYDWIQQSTGRYYNSVLEGVTVNAMGDSYFEGAGLESKYLWLSLLASKYGMDMNNYGRGGSTVTNYITTNSPMCERFDKMANNDPDIVLVEGGRNDFSKGATPGEVDSYDTTTFSGALNVILEGLKEKYPDAMIVCISNWNFPDKDGKEYTCYDFADAMEAVAERQGVYYIRACDPDVSGINMRSKSFRTSYCLKDTDVSHLNAAGMKIAMTYFEPILAEYYEDFLSKKQ